MEVTKNTRQIHRQSPLRRYPGKSAARGGALVPELGRLRGRRLAPRDGGERARRALRVLRAARGHRARPRRPARHHARGAHERHHVAHLRLRRHASEDRHPSRAGRSPPPSSRSRRRKPVKGDDFLHAFILGVEAECRIGNAVYPSHYDVGWHITGHDRRVRRGRGRGQAARAERAADGVGARHRRDAVMRACARCSARW